ncbi:MATE family efflux transporter [Micromonospora marina]|uniref:MATE family efflux transporter n=1 Tax=Micromonospora marina TaxID=307120 RepID=UPI003452607E
MTDLDDATRPPATGDDPAAATTYRRKGLLRLSWPLLLVSFLALATSFVDTILLSAHSEQLNAAVSIANQILGVGYDLSTLLSIGALVLVAQYLGKGDLDSARRSSAVAVVGNTAVGALIALVLVILAPLLVDAVNTPAEIRRDTVLYVWTVGAAMIFNSYLVAATAVLRAYGHTVEILVLGILANIAYLFLEYGLLFGAFGLPKLDVLGAALSTVIVRILGVLLVTWVIRRRLGFSVLRLPARAWRRPVRTLLRLSTPSVGENIAYDLAQLGVVATVALLGVSAVLGRSYALTLSGFVTIVVLALAQGNEILIGYDKGADDHTTARRRALRNAGWAALWSTAAAIALWAATDPLLALFSANADVVNTVRILMLIGILAQPCQAVATILFGSLRSAGDVNIPVAISIGTTALIMVPLSALLVPPPGTLPLPTLDLGVAGVWIALLAAEATKAVLFTHRWRRHAWTRHRLVDDTPGDATGAGPARSRSR